MSISYPIQRLTVFVEPFYHEEKLIGFVCYFPLKGLMEMKSEAFIQIEYIRSMLIFDSMEPSHETLILERSLVIFSTYFPVKYVVNTVSFDMRMSDPTPILSKFQFEMYHMIPHMRHSLKIQKEKIHFCDIKIPIVSSSTLLEEPSPEIEKILEDEVKIVESKSTVPPPPPPPPVVKTMWDYHGYHNDPPKPSPYDAFASHLDSEENGGYCRGQWDGHLNEKTIAQGIPYGIVDTHGNRDKIQDILSSKVVTKENELYGLFVNLLNATNSRERIQYVKDYLDERNLKYNDESFWIKEEGKAPVKQTFFKAVILPLVHQTPKYQYYLKKKNSH